MGTDTPTGRTPLGGSLRVIDLGEGISSGYCGKLLVDGGAEVVKVETPAGDALRRRRVLDAPAPDPIVGGPLFSYLTASTRSVVADPTSADDRAFALDLVRGADAVIWSAGTPWSNASGFSPRELREAAPRAIVVAISNFGLVNEPSPPANEFTLQGLAGGPNMRGSADLPPGAIGCDNGDYVAGLFAVQGLLTAHRRARVSGVGELVDVSMLDTLHLTQTMFGATFLAAAGRPMRSKRVRTIPLIHPTVDGYVGFQITTGQQWQDFCAMVGKPDWAEDPSLTRFDARIARFDEVNGVVDEWTSQHTTNDVVDLCVAFRIPVAPVNDGAMLMEFPQMVERDWVVTNPSGVRQPASFSTYHGSATTRPIGAAPRLGEHSAAERAALPAPKTASPTGADAELPFAGLRIADFTMFWAGPIIGHSFAMLGADVIHIESTKRPDGIRAATLQFDMSEGWWEASPTFAGTNTNKRDLTLDLSTEVGRALARRVIAESDVVIENFSSRVMPQLGLDYEDLRRINPRLIMLRAPGFGTSGPCADWVAYATTIEQACGAAWVTGFPEDRPDVAGGSMDPVAGTHASVAILLALEHRDRTGEGILIEAPQFTSGTSVFAELMLEYSAHGQNLGRIGNRSWTRAPQGAYRVLDRSDGMEHVTPDDWVFLSVENDEQWQALCALIGADDLASDASCAFVAGRRAAHDRIDDAISAWTRDKRGDDVEQMLRDAGIPAAHMAVHQTLTAQEPVQRRGLYEMVDTGRLGTLPIVGNPVQYEHGPRQSHRRRAPSLGEHNREILEGLLGLTASEVDALEQSGIIGTRAGGLTAW